MNMKKVIISLAIAACTLFGASAVCSAAVSSAPAAEKAAAKTETVTFKTSMHCAKCEKKVSENIGFEKGVKDLKTNLDQKTVTVTFDPSKTNKEKIAAAIKKLGYTAEEVKPENK